MSSAEGCGLCKLTIVLVLNRRPSGSSYQLCLVRLFVSLPAAASAFRFALCFFPRRIALSSIDY